MAIGVVAPNLMATIRAQPCAADANAGSFEATFGSLEIRDFESKMKNPSGPSLRRRVGQSRWRRLVMFQDQVDLCVAGLKPQAGKSEYRPVGPSHSQQIDVKPGAPLQVVDDQSDVIEGFDANGVCSSGSHNAFQRKAS